MSQHRSKFKRRDCSNLAQIENIFARLFQEGSCIARVPWWNSHAFVYNVRTRTFICSLSPVQSNNPYIAISNIRDRTFDREARILQTATVVKACDETRILRKNDIAIRSCTTCTRNTDNNTGKNNRKQRPLLSFKTWPTENASIERYVHSRDNFFPSFSPPSPHPLSPRFARA